MKLNEGDVLRKVIVCPPETEYFLVDDLESHNITEIADRKKAMAQHRELQRKMEASGAEVAIVKELPGHPNSVFTRDTALCAGDGYVRLRMGLPTRRGEEVWMSRILESMGMASVGIIDPPGTVEGGDVILAGGVAFVGHSSRTNTSGAEQMREILRKLGYEVRITDVYPGHLHLGGAMSMLDTETVLHCKGEFPEGFFDGFREMAVECTDFVGANVISLGNGELIANSANPKLADMLTDAGFRVHTIDLNEFVKGSGGPTCLILPVRRG